MVRFVLDIKLNPFDIVAVRYTCTSLISGPLSPAYSSLLMIERNLALNTTTLVKTLAISAGLAVVGYFLLKFINIEADNSLILAVGLFLGSFISRILVQDTPAEVQTKTLYVGNLPYRANEAAIRELFEEYGHVLSVRLMKDRQTGKRKGFGFVEMPQQDADKAEAALNDSVFQERTLKVREANERPSKKSSPDIHTPKTGAS